MSFRMSPPPLHTSSKSYQSRDLSTLAKGVDTGPKASQILMPSQPDIDQGKENTENQRHQPWKRLSMFPTPQIPLAAAHFCPSQAWLFSFLSRPVNHPIASQCTLSWLRLARVGFCCLRPEALRFSNIPTLPLQLLPENTGCHSSSTNTGSGAWQLLTGLLSGNSLC